MASPELRLNPQPVEIRSQQEERVIRVKFCHVSENNLTSGKPVGFFGAVMPSEGKTAERKPTY